MVHIEQTDLINAISTSLTMAEAATKLKLHFSTFKRHALKYNLYKPNTGGKGTKRPNSSKAIPLDEILNGLHPSYSTFKLKKRLYKANLKQNKCEECGIDSWCNKNLECELDHIDGDRTNHIFTNLRIICPNCHSQTHTYRFKKRLN
jgi:hypothetical protein